MFVDEYEDFKQPINDAFMLLKLTAKKPIMTEKWQGISTAGNPAMAMHEILHYSFASDIWTEDLKNLATDIEPNIPWADIHFDERVSGSPLNPGDSWIAWPYAHAADRSRGASGQFNHTYMERYWPRYAGDDQTVKPLRGIRHDYGDLAGIVHLLRAEPLTRQAYLPIFFPEDTGDTHDGRKPCTLGYHLIMRNGRLDIVYYIRSCDIIRHFRDDIYLTARLCLWVLDRLRELNPHWQMVKPGRLVMHITSLHCFANDYIELMKNSPL